VASALKKKEQVVSKQAEKLAAKLFENADDRAAFLHCLQTASARERCVVVLRDGTHVEVGVAPDPAPFQPDWVQRMQEDLPIGSQPAYEQGNIYPLDLSSVFSATAFREVVLGNAPILDLCAAPGGKTHLAWRALQPSWLVANEVIGKRLGPLVGNLTRTKLDNVTVTQMDPSALAEHALSVFGLTIVDAPCSGQSLRARGDDAYGCFHPDIISMNTRRQRRILGSAAETVAPGGWLAYMTCTYALDENERNAEWFMKKVEGWNSVPIHDLEAFRSPHSSLYCYRLSPQQGFGSGAFVSLFQKEGVLEESEAPDTSEWVIRRDWRPVPEDADEGEE